MSSTELQDFLATAVIIIVSPLQAITPLKMVSNRCAGHIKYTTHIGVTKQDFTVLNTHLIYI
jgi:hypothetical protein